MNLALLCTNSFVTQIGYPSSLYSLYHQSQILTSEKEVPPGSFSDLQAHTDEATAGNPTVMGKQEPFPEEDMRGGAGLLQRGEGLISAHQYPL